AAVRGDALDRSRVHPALESVRHAVVAQVVLEVEGLLVQPEDGFAFQPEGMAPADDPAVVARGLGAADEAALDRGPESRDGQALQAVLLGPHPPALIQGVAGPAHLTHGERPVVVRGERLADEAERAREQRLLSTHPSSALPEAGGVLLEAHHDLAVARDPVRATGPARDGAAEAHHPGGFFPAEGARDV